MLKYTNAQIVFQEFPNETTLAFNISNCPNCCPACHSKWLWDDIGLELNRRAIDNLIDKYRAGITCIGFMGGDSDINIIYDLARYVKSVYRLKTGWYSGRKEIPSDMYEVFDYIKIGPYIEEMGDLRSPSTNQRMYKRDGEDWIDITSEFQKNK